jgi:hypothetical protein
VVVPLAMWPLLSTGVSFFFSRSAKRAQEQQFRLALKQDVSLAGMAGSLEQAGFQIQTSDDPRQAVEDKTATEDVRRDHRSIARLSDGDDDLGDHHRHRIPIVNFGQLIKELILGDWSWIGFTLTLCSTIVDVGVAFWIAVRVFKNERILFRT